MLAAIPIFWTPFLGISLVFMLVYVWSREFPNAQINIYGLMTLKVCWRCIQSQIFVVWFHFLCNRFGFRILVSNIEAHLHPSWFSLVFSGILSPMGNACFRCHFWLPHHARSAGDYCGASILLFDCAASTCNWKDLTEDSKMGVSFDYLVPLFERCTYQLICMHSAVVIKDIFLLFSTLNRLFLPAASLYSGSD